MKPRKISRDTRAAVGALFPQRSQPLSVLNSASEISSSSTLVSVHSEISSPASVLAPVHARALFSCPGLVIDETNWPVSPDLPVEIHFPWLRRREGVDKLTFAVELFDGVLAARAFDCEKRACQDGTSCIPCSSLLPKVEAVAVNATEHKAHTRKGLLTPSQLLEDNHRLIEQINGLKLQSLNDVRKIKRALGKLEDHSTLVMALAEADVPWLRKLLHTALKNGASIRAIVRLIEDALEAGYRPRGHSTEANDLALLIYRLGGANLLYALNQRLHIPSLRTLRKKMSFIKIAPTIGRISIDTVQKNIHNIIIVPFEHAARTTRRGVSLLIDETAAEEAAVYMPQSNSVGGLCWTHSHRVDPVLRTYDSALRITNALKAETVHLGKEVTVAGAHIVGEDGFYPLLAAPTCKSEDAGDMEFIFNTLIDAWKATGADQRVGPLWFVATDGDATRRKGGHKTFLHTPLPITSPLYGTLSNLPGLNLRTGNDLVTLDFDFKHVFKRFCTLIRSRAGMYLNNGRCINSFLLERYLTMIDGIDEAATCKLLYLDDPQDVPRAVSLMRAVITLSQIDPVKWALNSDDPYPNADKIADFDALKIIGHILDNLLQPYTNVNLTISEQVVHLSCFAHLLYASYRNQHRRLMPNQLYYDSQSMVKNAIFTIAKQQELDSAAPHYVPNLGRRPGDQFRYHRDADWSTNVGPY
ncbi:hypothetical protein PAXINDRAFT_14668 [Paxillus involutus ATCC 200175]|uniref:Uncharacterized protein n=1 Tax=Paxillus involutus ATCC 200175 TaxID=664439 RepID=A0A0C9TXX0_PAXIN|nr:hypothetical protein PAXINDRAFT_14668 [Paxillus involutus ATCC 200175]